MLGYASKVDLSEVGNVSVLLLHLVCQMYVSKEFSKTINNLICTTLHLIRKIHLL